MIVAHFYCVLDVLRGVTAANGLVWWDNDLRRLPAVMNVFELVGFPVRESVIGMWVVNQVLRSFFDPLV